ncbi:MAG: alpha/beta fold hydrolase [Candidatus Thorarchaeota archaeon]
MPYFDNNGIKIYYEIIGDGPPVLMIHGFAASIEGNWKLTNWVDTLKDKYRLILLDCRGHGKSDKPLDPALYGAHMTDDIIKLIDYLSIGKANFFGYSMGSRLTLSILFQKQELFKSAILGGFALQFLSEEERPAAEKRSLHISEALEAENADSIKNPVGLRFRRFAKSMGADLNALAALSKGGFQPQVNEFQTNDQMKDALKGIKVPVMTVVGSDDFIPGDKTLIAQLVPDVCHFQIQGKDHLTVVPDPKFHMVVKAFLNHVNNI